MAASQNRILLIEDDEDDYLHVRELLASLDGEPFQLTWVADGEQGLQMLLRDAPDACLVDFRVGPRSGLELVCEAAALGCSVPTIIITGAGNEQVDAAAMRAGAAYYLEKTSSTASRTSSSPFRSPSR